MGISGSYLPKPATEKDSADDSNDRLLYGASSMQGWRVSQEDAHNCILDFDKSQSFFAVYDGHGGHEVAQYCSQKLPDFIKSTSAYKENRLHDALVEGFLGFDAQIATPDVIKVLKELAGDKDDEAEESDEEENVKNLYEEAVMPIEQVIEKYTKLANPAVQALKDKESPKSPCLKAKKDGENVVGTSSTSGICSEATSSSADCSGSSGANAVSSTSEADAKEGDVSASNGAAATSDTIIPEIKISLPDSSDSKEVSPVGSSGQVTECSTQNGDSPQNDVTSSSPSSGTVENGDSRKKDKGKRRISPQSVVAAAKVMRPTRNAQQLYKQWLDFGGDSSGTDEEDQMFEEPSYNSKLEGEEEEDDGEEEDEEEGEESSSDDEEETSSEEGDDADEDEDGMDENLAFAFNMKEQPGSDSGCTAVVALLAGTELYVANAGDSRCIVCRNGKAIDMSIDHKPEDEPERERIVKAGGRVTSEGRVNDGLNLSRAIGDHAYKQNKDLSDREQMITALPDVKTLTVNPNEDEFMVLACDGIWNSMSSQEVVDFVRPRITAGDKTLSEICEELFDRCLAPSSMGDGTGCDNMTAIIVKFKTSILKRANSPGQSEAEEKSTKKAKTDNNEDAQIDTTV